MLKTGLKVGKSIRKGPFFCSHPVKFQYHKRNQPRFDYESLVTEKGLWISGGYENLNSTEIILSNGSRIDGPDLPDGRRGHCLVQYEDTIILTGGDNKSPCNECV